MIRDGAEGRAPIGSLAAAAELIGADWLPDDLELSDEPLTIDPAAAAALASAYAVVRRPWSRSAPRPRGTISRPSRPSGPSTSTWRSRWALRTPACAPTTGSRRETRSHPEPYFYVGPWTAKPRRRAVECLELQRRRARIRRDGRSARPGRCGGRVRARAKARPGSSQGGSMSGNGSGSGASGASLEWHRVLDADELPEGRVTTVAAGHKSVALVHYDGQFSALDNHCPHQGGPLGEGSIEQGMLRCPWHGYDYCPLDGSSPGFDDEATTYPLEIRDGAIFVGVEPEAHRRTVSDAMAETMVNLGRPPRLRHGRAFQPRSRRRPAPPGGGGEPRLHRHPPRGRRRLRRIRLRQAHRPPRRLPLDRRPRSDKPAHRPLGRKGRPLAGAGPDRSGRHPGRRPRARFRRSTSRGHSALSPPSANPSCATPSTSS